MLLLFLLYMLFWFNLNLNMSDISVMVYLLTTSAMCYHILRRSYIY